MTQINSNGLNLVSRVLSFSPWEREDSGNEVAMGLVESPIVLAVRNSS